VAVRTSGLFDSRIEGNVMGGRAGVLGEIAENTVIEDNRILTSAIGVFALAFAISAFLTYVRFALLFLMFRRLSQGRIRVGWIGAILP